MLLVVHSLNQLFRMSWLGSPFEVASCLLDVTLNGADAIRSLHAMRARAGPVLVLVTVPVVRWSRSSAVTGSLALDSDLLLLCHCISTRERKRFSGPRLTASLSLSLPLAVALAQALPGPLQCQWQVCMF